MQSDSLWGKIKQGIKEGATSAAVKAEHLSKQGRIRLDMARTRRAIQNTFSDLGSQVYNLFEQNPDALVVQKEDLQKQIQTIKELEAQLVLQEGALKKLQETEAAPPPVSPEEE